MKSKYGGCEAAPYNLVDLSIVPLRRSPPGPLQAHVERRNDIKLHLSSHPHSWYLSSLAGGGGGAAKLDLAVASDQTVLAEIVTIQRSSPLQQFSLQHRQLRSLESASIAASSSWGSYQQIYPMPRSQVTICSRKTQTPHAKPRQGSPAAHRLDRTDPTGPLQIDYAPSTSQDLS